MNFAVNPYFTKREKIELLQNWLIVHSIIYYSMGEAIATDAKFDDNCRQLVDMARSYPDIFLKSKYHYCFYDFDGSTGFDLPGRLNREDKNKFIKMAVNIVRRMKNEN